MVFWFEVNSRGYHPRFFLLADLVVHNRTEKFVGFLRPADKRSLAGFGFGYLAAEYIHADVWRPEFFGPGDQLGDAFGGFGLADGLDDDLDFYCGVFIDYLDRGAGFYRLDDRGTREGPVLTLNIKA